MKLWQKDATEVPRLIETFTVGRDRDFDLLLAPYDVQASLAHVRMLQATGLLSAEELAVLERALEEIGTQIRSGIFSIDPHMEDVHSQIEYQLTLMVGAAGKKVHSGRSRNDQVAVAIKLYLRSELQEIKALVEALFQRFLQLAAAHQHDLMPGYTHLQLAMPSSFGLWFGAWAESLTDDMELLAAAYRMANRNPLGSGAGYGSSFPLDRGLTTRLLGFERMHYNSMYAQMSRGRTERSVAVALASLAATMGRFSMDACLFLNQHFGFISFPDQLTTGSSIMPHKKNPDVFELIRARCNRIQSVPNELSLLMANLPSGYHRDMQLTKEILFPAIESVRQCLELMLLMLDGIRVQQGLLDDGRFAQLFTVERVQELVRAGVPFREAYVQVGREVASGTFSWNGRLEHTHEGSIGNLCLAEIAEAMEAAMGGFNQQQRP